MSFGAFMRTQQSFLSVVTILTATLSFLAASSLAGTKPTVVTNPVSQTLSVGDTLTLSVAVTGDLPITYRWRRFGNIVSMVTTNETISTLVITNMTTNRAGLYDVVVNNASGNAPSGKRVSVTVLHSGLASNTFALGITGVTSWTYRLEYATNLLSTNWNVLTNITMSPTSPFYQHPPESTSNGQRFYRLIPTTE